MELFHNKVCGAEFVEQCQTPSKSSKSRNTIGSILEEAEAKNRTKGERASWGENHFYNKNYRYFNQNYRY